MPSPPRVSRLRRGLLAALVTASVAVPVAGAAGPADVPAPAPAVRGPLRSAVPEALAERYAATRADIRAAERTAAGHGDRGRAAALHTMAEPGRRFLFFDGRDGGRGAEVFGDLAHAQRIAVLVPGAGIGLDHYARLRDGGAALQGELGDGSAVVAWLGYRTPATVGPAALTPGRAAEAAPALRDFVGELRALGPGVRTTLVCHSYGSVVCARSAHGLPVEDIVLYGSPGTGYRTAADLRTTATVWAGRGGDDWIGGVPHLRLRLPFTDIGFGTDPVSPAFGARIFAAGDGGHSDYLKPGSVPLKSIAGIVAGTAPAASPAMARPGERHA
ncbi:alpha/beta hydrolase [Streptomyces sp. NPDC052042]|uniref:alpha/beta hydrolase n=1 Tax=Streptomyces sp. NPDC052042 TaxID=3365683 RepID=UPI0037D98A0C